MDEEKKDNDFAQEEEKNSARGHSRSEPESEVEIEFLTPKGKHPKSSDEDLKKLKNKLKRKDKEIKEFKGKLNKFKNDYLRLAADKENLRKRLEKEKQDYYKYALEDVLREFLTILDNLERALISKEDHKKNVSFHEGIEMIYKQFRDLFLKQGVIPIEIKEGKFDPYIHQAFMSEESDEVDEPRISEELQKGYKLHDRLLRPSLVKVTVPKKDK